MADISKLTVNNAQYSLKDAEARQDISGKVSGPSSSTANHVATFSGTTGKVIKDSGFTIGKSVPSDAVFTDTTVYYTICETAASTQTKEVSISEVTELTEGLSVYIEFVHKNTYNGVPKLKINSLEAKSIMLAGISPAGSSWIWSDGEMINLVYNGDNFVIVNGSTLQSIKQKININQGTTNAGKFLIVNSSGNVEPVSMTAWQGGSY